MSTNPMPKRDTESARRTSDRLHPQLGEPQDPLPAGSINAPSPELSALRRKKLLRHIDRVLESCTVLGERLIDQDEGHMGHQLIANGYCHDNSKFYGIEWLYLHDEVKQAHPNLFNAAWTQHVTTNRHHPEYWDGIGNMPRVYLAEMVCDWHARSSEFGSDLRAYIEQRATRRFHFDSGMRVYRDIKDLVNLLLDPSFDDI